MPTSLKILGVSLLCLCAVPALGQSDGRKQTSKSGKGGEIADLEAQMVEMRRELNEIKFILSEVIRLDRRRADTLERALKSSAVTKSAPPPTRTRRAPPLAEEPKTKTRAPSLASGKSRRTRSTSSKSSDGAGVISGKVAKSSSEPVAYVYVENVRGRLVSGKSVQIEQSNKQFRPRWAVVEKGTTVGFPNKDNIFHNVFSRSPGNTFDLGLYRKGESAKSHRFIRPGPVDVYCNIHPRMSASILVVPNRYFAKVKPDGSYTINGVPPGKRKVVAWAPSSEPNVAWVDVQDGQTTALDLKLTGRRKAHKNKLGRPYGSYE